MWAGYEVRKIILITIACVASFKICKLNSKKAAYVARVELFYAALIFS